MTLLGLGVSGTRTLRQQGGGWEERAGPFLILLEQAAMEASAWGRPWRLVHGGCTGVDELAAHWAAGRGYHVHGVIPPDATRLFRDWRDTCDTWEFIEPGPDGYKRRNLRLVALSRLLVAGPEYLEHDARSQRSGTWQTIRLAINSAHCDVSVLPLGGRDENE